MNHVWFVVRTKQVDSKNVSCTMELGLEDLFAEPPPKIRKNANGFTTKSETTKDVDRDELQRQLISVPIKADECKHKFRSDSFSQQKTDLPTSSNEKPIFSGAPVNEIDKGNAIKPYHIPNLGQILQSSVTVSGDNKRTDSYIVESGDTTFFGPDGKNTAFEKVLVIDKNKNSDMLAYQSVGKSFRERFTKKDSGPSIERKMVDDRQPIEKKGAFLNEGQSNSFSEGNEQEESLLHNPASTLKKRKAGNYLRKLHTKCRVSAKTIRNMEKSGSDNGLEFFGEISDRPLILGQNSNEFENDNYLQPGKVKKCIDEQSQQGQNISRIRTEKYKAKKKRNKERRRKEKALKRKGKLKLKNGDDLSMTPRKDAKPHKWPVSMTKHKQNLISNRSSLHHVEASSMNDDNGENIGTVKETCFIEKTVVENSVLDNILSQSSNLMKEFKKPGMNNEKHSPTATECQDDALSSTSNIQAIQQIEPNKIQNVPPNNCTTDSCNENSFSSIKTHEKGVYLSNSCSFSKPNDVNSLLDLKGSLNTNVQGQKMSHSGTLSNLPKLTGCERSPINLNNSKDMNRPYIFQKQQSASLGLKKDNKILVENYNGKDDLRRYNGNQGKFALSEDSDSPINASKKTLVKNMESTKQWDGEKMPEKKTQVAENGQSLDPDFKARNRRGGQKRKKRKSKRDMASKESRPKVRCKYFLDGKCRQGQDCQFLHEGTPRRRELCRYFVTDSCLAEKCIFMHSEFPCKFFHTTSKCNNGDKCKYSHEPLTEETDNLLKQLLARDEMLKKETEPESKSSNATVEKIARPVNQSSNAAVENSEEDSIDRDKFESKFPSLYQSLI